MPDYQKMYYAVCSGVSRVLDHIPDNDLFRETKKQLADVLLEAEEDSAADTASPNFYVQTLRNLPQLLPGSGYAAVCSVEQLAQVSRDYLSIKALRNLANHASDRPTDDQEQLLDYLEEYGYARPENLSLSDIKAAILTALDNLQQAGERKKEA